MKETAWIRCSRCGAVRWLFAQFCPGCNWKPMKPGVIPR